LTSIYTVWIKTLPCKLNLLLTTFLVATITTWKSCYQTLWCILLHVWECHICEWMDFI